MKTIIATLAALGLGVALAGAQSTIVNTNIDMPAYLKIARAAAADRVHHRLSEDEFIRLSQEPGTAILDARSHEMFDRLHVKGAINLSFPDIAAGSLAQTFPDKNQRILIYCNNNFFNEPVAFATKSARASLNLSTYIALYSYGYTNVYELEPFLDIHTTKIEFVRKAEPTAEK